MGDAVNVNDFFSFSKDVVQFLLIPGFIWVVRIERRLAAIEAELRLKEKHGKI